VATIALTQDNFKETLEREGVIVIDWWAEWCGPCRAFAPVFEAAAKKYPDVTFAKVDTDAQQELAGAFSISAIPTLMVFRDRVLLFNQAGALPPRVLDELIEKAKSLDMDEIRREIAEEQRSAASEGDGEQKKAAEPEGA
jgi:thioredoxin 1